MADQRDEAPQGATLPWYAMPQVAADRLMGECTGAAWKVYTHITREIAAWHVESTVIPLSQFTRVCKLTDPAVLAALTQLKRYHAIEVEVAGRGRGRISTYRITAPATWTLPPCAESIPKEIIGIGVNGHIPMKSIPKEMIAIPASIAQETIAIPPIIAKKSLVLIKKEYKEPIERTSLSEVASATTPTAEAAAPSTPTKTFAADSEPFLLAQYLAAAILAHKPDAAFVPRTPAKMQNWAIVTDQMIRLDHRDPATIRAVIDWATRDVDFWQGNILSPGSLRKQFDRLEIKVRAAKKQPSRSRFEPPGAPMTRSDPYHRSKGSPPAAAP
jgi:hypothetical protein